MDLTNKLEDSILKIRFVIKEKHGFNKLEDSILKIRFVIEEKHGFNKQTVGFYIKDQVCY